MGFRAASASEVDLWQDGWQTRTVAWHARSGYSTAELAAVLDAVLVRHKDPENSMVTAMTGDDGSLVGFVAASLRCGAVPVVGVLDDIWVDPARRRAGLGRAGVAHAIAWCRHRATQLELTNDPDDPAATALFGRHPLRSQTMRKTLSGAPEIADTLTARPLTEQEFPAWRVTEVDVYASGLMTSGALSPQDAQDLSERTYAALLPQGLTTVDNSIWTIETGADRRSVAAIWVRHRNPDGVSYVYAVTVPVEQRRRGYGRAVMLVGERAAVAAGDRYLALNVFGYNTAATTLYHSLDYRVVSQRRFVAI